jgi:transcription initiation factor TFIIIB Brf1 subunit/transcription initiation factor TFIIB
MEPKCPECGSVKFSRDLGEVFCRGCGFVIDEKLAISG